MRIGLVIQGPLISSGVGGDGYKVENFRCGQQIIRLIDDFHSLFNFICVSTWNNSDEEELNILKQAKIKVIQSQPLTKLGICEWETASVRNQLISSLAGIKKCIDYKMDFSLKIRTDQYFNIAEFLNQFHKLSSGSDLDHLNKIQGLFAWPNRPLSMIDFVYFGKTSNLLKLFKYTLLNLDQQISSVLSPWPEGEICRKYIYLNKKKLNKIEKYLLFINTNKLVYPKPQKLLDYLIDPYFGFRPTKRLLENVQKLQNKFFITSDLKVTKSLIWRGVPISKPEQYCYKTLDNRYSKISKLDLIYWINLKKYLIYFRSSKRDFFYPVYLANRFINFLFYFRRILVKYAQKPVKHFRYF